LIDAHDNNAAALSVVSTRVSQPFGLGRILRDTSGNIQGIVEEKDATDEQRQIQEINAAIYIADAIKLKNSLSEIGTDNAQQEKYLTDAVALLQNRQEPVTAFELEDAWLAAGINDRVQLSEIAAELNRRIVMKWQRAGVTIQDPS